MLTLAAVCPITAQAFTSDGINYKILSSNTVSVSSNASASGSILIPAQVEYNGTVYTVTSISDEAFSSTGITSIKLPETILTIGGNAFIETALTELIIPNSVTSIGDGSFAFCSKLVKLQLGSSVSKIGADIFTGLTALEEVISLNPVPPTVNTWGTTTTSATLYVPESAISSYSSASVWKQFKNIKGVAEGSITISSFNNLTQLTVGNLVTRIDPAFFKDNSGMNKLSLGSGLKEIGEEAFRNCTSLEEVIIPVNVESIGASAFAGNSRLTNIVMGANVKTIGEKAFDGCPASTIYITAQTPPAAPNNTFSNYSGMLYLEGGQPTIDAYYDAYTCWDRFDGYAMIEPTEMQMSDSKIIGKPGDTFQLTANLIPADVTLPQIFWHSTNPEIATVGNNGLVTIHAGMDKIKALAEGDDDNSHICKIIAQSLYANGPIKEVTVTDASTGIDEIIVNDPASGEIDLNAPVEVYNLNGLKVADSIETLAPGIYIVRQGVNVRKIAIK